MTDWRDLAACKGWPTDWWFPGRGEMGVHIDEHPAMVICASCPVREKCLEYALDAREVFGIWGGTSERQRRRMRSQRRREAVA